MRFRSSPILLVLFIASCMLIPWVAAIEEIDMESAAFKAASLELQHTIRTGFNIESTGRAQLLTLNASLLYAPPDNRWQTIQSTSTLPLTGQIADALSFQWDEPQDGQHDIVITTTVRTSNTLSPVDRKVAFPLEDIPPEAQVYLGATPTIDITPEIRAQANRLAARNDDLYVVAHTMADWIQHNVNYSLSSSTAGVSLPASWVFVQKQGACDELSTLFISMMRSVGVPARFASGISYTSSSLFTDKWSPHAWAEVYFPGIGWVPFDIAYREFGFIDASHIQTRYSSDANDSVLFYNWRGYDVEQLQVSVDPIMATVIPMSQSGTFEFPVQIEIEPYARAVGFGSYDRIDITLRNPTDRYISVALQIALPQEATLLSANNPTVLLLPHADRTIHVPLRIGRLDSGLQYELPIIVATNWGQTQSMIVASASFPQIEKAAIELEDDALAQNAKSRLIANCSAPPQVYVNDTFDIICTIINRGNILENVRVCHDRDCQQQQVLIKQNANFLFPVVMAEPGTREYTLLVTGDAGRSRQQVTVRAHEKPMVRITSFTATPTVLYGQEVPYDIKLNITGQPLQLRLQLQNTHIPMLWSVEASGEYRTEGKLDPLFFDPDQNHLTLTVFWQDDQGILQQTSAQTDVTIEGVPSYGRVKLWILRLLQRIG